MRRMQGEISENRTEIGGNPGKETEKLDGVEKPDWKEGRTEEEVREIEASLERWKEFEKRSLRAEKEQNPSGSTFIAAAKKTWKAAKVFLNRAKAFFYSLFNRPVYSKIIRHDEWMLIRAETGYIIYNYEFGYLKNPKVTIKSPAVQTDYITDPNGYGHLLIRRGFPIGIGGSFKVKVEIR